MITSSIEMIAVPFAIIKTLPIFVATITSIGLSSYLFGKFYQQYAWNRTDSICDLEDSLKYMFALREKAYIMAENFLENEEEILEIEDMEEIAHPIFVIKPMKTLNLPSAHHLFDLSDIDSINLEKDLASIEKIDYINWVNAIEMDLRHLPN